MTYDAYCQSCAMRAIQLNVYLPQLEKILEGEAPGLQPGPPWGFNLELASASLRRIFPVSYQEGLWSEEKLSIRRYSPILSGMKDTRAICSGNPHGAAVSVNVHWFDVNLPSGDQCL